jgi:hypothetical protein
VSHHHAHRPCVRVDDVRADRRLRRRPHPRAAASRGATSMEQPPPSTHGQGATRAELAGSIRSEGNEIPALSSAARNSSTVTSASSTQSAACCAFTLLPRLSEFHSSHPRSDAPHLHSAGVCPLRVRRGVGVLAMRSSCKPPDCRLVPPTLPDPRSAGLARVRVTQALV